MATIDHVPDALHLPKRRDRDPPPVTQAMQPNSNPSHIAANTMTNTMTTDSMATNVQGYAHPGFTMPSFPPFSAPAFPMQYPTMPPYHIPTPLYAPPYGYPFVPQGTQAMQPHGYPAPYMMPNYQIPNHPPPASMYPPPSGYPFAMPSQVSNAQNSFGPAPYDLPDTDQSNYELLAATERDPTPEP